MEKKRAALEHFPIIQAICRICLSQNNEASVHQVERLRDALAESGDGDAAGSLSRLLKNASNTVQMAPSKLTRSATSLGGELMSSNTSIPTDRETSGRLAHVIPIAELPEEPPLFNETFAAALSSMMNEWERVDVLAAHGMNPTRTCMIYGAPGTGKTHLAMWMARQLRIPVVVARLDGLVSSFLGTTSRNIGALFDFANRYRCLLLLDEFDAIAKVRDDPQEVGEIKRVVNTVLQNLDARQAIGFTIAVTNHETLLDPAIWRRFEVQLSIPRPSFDARVAIAKSYARNESLSESEFKLMAWVTAGATGAEVETLVHALRKALALSPNRRVMLPDILQQFAALNAGRLDPKRHALLQGERSELARALVEDAELEINRSDVAGIYGFTPSAISKILSGKRKQKSSARC